MPNPVGTSAGLLRYAVCSLFVWDYFLTFEQERLHIWCQRWTLSKFLFLFLRYTTFAMIILDTYFATASGVSDLTCGRYNIGGAIITIIILITVQVILQLRIYMMYGRRKDVLIVNGCLMAVEIAVMLVVCLNEFTKVTKLTAPDWVIGSCYNKHEWTMSASFFPPFLFESYMAGLATYKLVQSHRISRVRRPFVEQGILGVLVRDSVVYFAFIAVAMAVNIALLASSPVSPGLASTGIVYAAGEIGGTRIIFSMHNSVTSSLPQRGLSISGVSVNVQFRAFHDASTTAQSKELNTRKTSDIERATDIGTDDTQHFTNCSIADMNLEAYA